MTVIFFGDGGDDDVDDADDDDYDDDNDVPPHLCPHVEECLPRHTDDVRGGTLQQHQGVRLMALWGKWSQLWPCLNILHCLDCQLQKMKLHQNPLFFSQMMKTENLLRILFCFHVQHSPHCLTDFRLGVWSPPKLNLRGRMEAAVEAARRRGRREFILL